MKKWTLYLFALFTHVNLSFSQPDYSHGIFNTDYQSSYPNGNKKTIGKINHNQRVGNWEFYSEDGTLIAKINYRSNTEFTTLETHNGKTTSLAIPLYEYDKLFQLPLEEHHVEWTKRIYRDIPANQFRLAPDFNFFKFLDSMQSDKILYFSDDQFQNKITSARELMDEDKEICGYRIKLDYFFRNDFNFMDSRIVGIAPLYKTPDGKIKEICWLYYHGLKDIVFEKIINTENRSMETILQTRSYGSTIYKENNISNKILNELSTDSIDWKHEKIDYEIDKSIIEAENDLIIKSYF
nr:hypothetical protein [uncultured Fluviicola sp.]